MDLSELKSFLVELIDEEFAPKGVELASRWQGGKVILEPGNDSQSKEIPIEVLFKKLLSIRDSLRVLEQKINSQSQLSAEDKLNLQAYLSKAYGSLTTFNILFKEDKHKFIGSRLKKDSSSQQQMSLQEAKKKLGLNEYD